MRTESLALFALLLACSRVENLASDPDAGAGESDASLDAELPRDADELEPDVEPVTYDAGLAYCGKRLCECSDGIDNDGDDRIDGMDPECTGAADDSESNFGLGARVPDRKNGCVDCFFDDNAGFDDGCSWDIERSSRLETRPGNGGGPKCDSDPSLQCVQNCEPLVPNGCDCFGCCGVTLGPQTLYVLLRSTCSMQNLENESDCPRCIPTSTCFNPCEECELCPGRPLPARCAGKVDCADRTACSSAAECRTGEYCLQGCCFPQGF